MLTVPGNAFAQRKEMERQEMERRQTSESELQHQANHAPPNMPYPQQHFYSHQQQAQPVQIQPVYLDPNKPLSHTDSLKDERGRPLTTWSLIDNAIHAQQQSPPYVLSTGQRSVTDPTNGPHGRQVELHNPSAEQTGGLRRRAKLYWQPFGRGRKPKRSRPPQVPIEMIHNANLRDPALERNQPSSFRPVSQSSEVMMPRRTPPARYAALASQHTSAMPAHLSTATVRTNVTAQSQYVMPVHNDALLMGSGPMIPTRDGNYAATAMPRTVQGQPVTSMMGKLESFSPSPRRHSLLPQQSSPLPQILETGASASSTAYRSPNNHPALPGGVQIHPFIYDALHIPEAEKEQIARSQSADGTGPVRQSGKSLILKLDNQHTQTPKAVKRSSSHQDFRNASAATPAAQTTVLSPSAPVFTPGTDMFRVPAYSQQAQFTVEQLITRIDRLQIKQEADRQLLYQLVNRQTQDRLEIERLRKVREVGRTPVRDFSSGEIGSGWYNQI